MANVIKTVLTYDLNGQTTDFTIPFEYLARKFIVVTLIGVDRKVLTLTTDYRFATRTTISTTKAWGPADGYTQIELRRVTSATERLVDFTDGSILRAYDLNVAQIQTMHVAEEARDLTADTIGVNNDGHLDARGRRIVNLADAQNDGDAISFGQVKRMNQNAWQARNEAQGFRNESEQFRDQTEGFRNEALAFKNQAEDSKNHASQSADAAGFHHTQSSQMAQAAAQSAREADQSAQIVVPLVPKVEQASKDAAQAAKDAHQAVQDVRDLGAVPVGTIVMFGSTVIPAGFISLMEDNPTFDVTEFPDLARLYPDGRLPSYKDRVPEGIGNGITVGQKRAGNVGSAAFNLSTNTVGDHTHPAWTDQQGAHAHTYQLDVQNGGPYALQDGGVLWGHQPRSTDVQGAHGHNIGMSPAGNHAHVITGTVGSGRNLVDATGTIFAIKAAGAVANEGLMEVTAIKQEIQSVRDNKVDRAGDTITGNFRINGKLLMSGGELFSSTTTGLSLRGTSYSFLTSPLDAHLCWNAYWDGAAWRKYNNTSPSSYLVINQVNNGIPRLMQSPAGSTNPNEHASYFYGQFNKPEETWWLVKGDDVWNGNQNVDFQIDMRGRTIMFEVIHDGHRSTAIGCTNNGDVEWQYWTYGGWEYAMQWINQNTLRMVHWSSGAQPIRRIWVRTFK